VQRGETLRVVLCGGDNSTQQTDIERAKRLAKDRPSHGNVFSHGYSGKFSQ
jgi:putative component of toxin-antitoxin plasmid stabilization module